MLTKSGLNGRPPGGLDSIAYGSSDRFEGPLRRFDPMSRSETASILSITDELLLRIGSLIKGAGELGTKHVVKVDSQPFSDS